MLKLLISAISCLALTLSSFSQEKELLWLEGTITHSDLDSVQCEIYIYDWETKEWNYMTKYAYGDTYAISFDSPEYYALVFTDSNSQYVLHVAVRGKAFKVANVRLDADANVLVRSTDENPTDYIVELMD